MLDMELKNYSISMPFSPEREACTREIERGMKRDVDEGRYNASSTIRQYYPEQAMLRFNLMIEFFFFRLSCYIYRYTRSGKFNADYNRRGMDRARVLHRRCISDR